MGAALSGLVLALLLLAIVGVSCYSERGKVGHKDKKGGAFLLLTH